MLDSQTIPAYMMRASFEQELTSLSLCGLPHTRQLAFRSQVEKVFVSASLEGVSAICDRTRKSFAVTCEVGV